MLTGLISESIKIFQAMETFWQLLGILQAKNRQKQLKNLLRKKSLQEFQCVPVGRTTLFGESLLFLLFHQRLIITIMD